MPLMEKYCWPLPVAMQNSTLVGIVGMRNRTTSRGAFLVCVKLTDIFQTSCFSSKMQRGAAARGFILVSFIGGFNRF